MLAYLCRVSPFLSLLRPLLWRLLLVFALFSLSRLLFWASNHSYFPQTDLIAFIGGWRFDISSLFAINALLILLSLIPWARLQNSKPYRIILLVIFILTNAIAFGFEMADVEYFKFTLKRSTSDLIELMQTGDDMKNLAPSFIRDYWYLVLVWMGIVALLFMVGRKTTPKAQAILGWKNWGIWSLGFCLIVFLTVIGIRGGFQLRPLSSISASAYGGNKSVPVVLNTSFSMITSAGKERLPDLTYFEEEELNSLYLPVTELKPDSSFNGKNVVIILLESFSEEYIGALSGNESYTPFLDSLIQVSTRAKHSFANGRKSMEAVPAVLSGIPSWMTRPFISSSYAANQVNSLPEILKQQGYSTMFFHGGNNGTMGFDRFAKAVDIESYYGRVEYGNDGDYDGQWGIFDEPFLQFCAKTMDEKQKPFFSTIFTLSSHHPYTIPEQYKGIFKEGDLPIYPTVQYSDLALRKFFETASKMDWYDNTIFVITADHTQLSNSDYYLSKLGQYRIPLLYFIPEESPTMTARMSQQIDIMPSVLDLLDYEGEFVSFGSSIFGDNHVDVVMTYLNGQYQILNENYVAYFDGEALLSLYDYKQDMLLLNDLRESLPSIAEDLEMAAKARIQSFNFRMNHNELKLSPR